MAMRSQVYEWDASRAPAATAANPLSLGQKYSIFIGGVGNNITKPAETTATQFVVLEDCAVTGSDYGIYNVVATTDKSESIRQTIS